MNSTAKALRKATLKRAFPRGTYVSTPAKAGYKEEPAEAG